MRTALAIAALAAVAGVGCVMPDQMSQVQKDVADVQVQMRAIQRNQQETVDQIEAVAANARAGGGTPVGSEVSREDLADLLSRIEALTRQVSMNGDRMTDLGMRLDQFSQQVASVQTSNQFTQQPGPVYELPGGPYPGIENPIDGTTTSSGGTVPTVPAGGAGGGRSEAIPDPEALYNTAYADFSKGNYSLAISGFEEYESLFPDSPLADNALYWIGECHYSQGDYRQAVTSIDRLLERFPRSDKAAAGNLKKAMAYQEQNQIGRAIVQFQYVLSTYPGTDESRIARDKLDSLGALSDPGASD